MLLLIFSWRRPGGSGGIAAHGYATIWLNAESEYKGNTQPAALTGLHSDSNINLQKPGGKRKKGSEKKEKFFFWTLLF